MSMQKGKKIAYFLRSLLQNESWAGLSHWHFPRAFGVSIKAANHRFTTAHVNEAPGVSQGMQPSYPLITLIMMLESIKRWGGGRAIWASEPVLHYFTALQSFPILVCVWTVASWGFWVIPFGLCFSAKWKLGFIFGLMRGSECSHLSDPTLPCLLRCQKVNQNAFENVSFRTKCSFKKCLLLDKLKSVSVHFEMHNLLRSQVYKCIFI